MYISKYTPVKEPMYVCKKELKQRGENYEIILIGKLQYLSYTLNNLLCQIAR